MQIAISDASLYFKRISHNLAGICAFYVDDTLHAGSETYSRLVKKIEEKFQYKSREWDNVSFSGVQFAKVSNGFIHHQKKYIEKLCTI